jgi:hypothetical protein
VVTAPADVKAIADNAVAAMKLAFDTAKSHLGTVNTTLATPKSKSPNPTLHADSKGKNDNRRD